MTQLTSLPSTSDAWTCYLKKYLEYVDQAVDLVFFSNNKVSYVQSELNSFVDQLSKMGEKVLSHKQIQRLFEFSKATAAFIGIIYSYHPKRWLHFFMNHKLCQSYNDINELWNAWSDCSSTFCFSSFQNFDELSHHHGKDLIYIYQLLTKNIGKFNQDLQAPVHAKIEQIMDVLQSPLYNSAEAEDNSNILQHSDWEIINPNIGQGGYAVVKLAKFKATGQEIAVKELTSTQLTPRRINYLKREIHSMRRLHHPNLLNMIGVTVTPPFCIATIYIPNGSLYDYMRTDGFTDLRAAIVALDVARGIEYLHAQGMIHRDLKPPNILMDSHYRAIVCDFGLTRMTSPVMTTELGTCQWMAPEILKQGETYDNSIDVYAYGMILYEMATKKHPFEGFRSMQVASMVINGERLPLEEFNLNPKLQDLIQRCWHQDPTKRPSMHQIVAELETGNIAFGNSDSIQFRQWIKKTAPQHMDAMEAITKQQSDSQTLISRLNHLNPLDPIAIPTLQKIIEMKINDSTLISDIIALATQKTSEEVQKLALKVLEKLFESAALQPQELSNALIELWETQSTFVVTNLRKYASMIENKQNFIKTLLTEKTQNEQTVDAMEAIAEIDSLPFIFDYLYPPLILQTLSITLNKFGPHINMVTAAVSSFPALSLMIRAVIKAKNYQSICIEDDKAEKIEQISEMLTTGYFINQAKNLKYVIETLQPLFIAGGPGMATLQILKAATQFKVLDDVINKSCYWAIIAKSLDSNRNEIVFSAIEIMFALKAENTEIQLVWDPLIKCFDKTHNEKALQIIQEYIKKVQGLEQTEYLLTLVTGFGFPPPKNELFFKAAFDINLNSRCVRIDKLFLLTVAKSLRAMNPTGVAAVALFLLKWKSETKSVLISYDLTAELLNFLYRQTPAITCIAPVIQYLFLLINDKDSCIYLVKNHFIRYLHQLPVRYPNDQRINHIIANFAKEMAQYAPQKLVV